MISDVAQFMLRYFITIFVVISPLAAIALFVSMTALYTAEERVRTAKISCQVAFWLMAFFALVGQKIFEFFGISIGSFYIAGGVLVFLVGLDMLRAQDTDAQPDSNGAQKPKDDISITPFAVPIIAGPCVITNIIALQSKAANWVEFSGGVVVLAVVMLLMYALLILSARGARWLTPTVLRLSYRLSGLILAALAVEMFISGIKSDDLGLWTHDEPVAEQQMMIDQEDQVD